MFGVPMIMGGESIPKYLSSHGNWIKNVLKIYNHETTSINPKS